jgi:hypothetical protein
MHVADSLLIGARLVREVGCRDQPYYSVSAGRKELTNTNNSPSPGSHRMANHEIPRSSIQFARDHKTDGMGLPQTISSHLAAYWKPARGGCGCVWVWLLSTMLLT